MTSPRSERHDGLVVDTKPAGRVAHDTERVVVPCAGDGACQPDDAIFTTARS